MPDASATGGRSASLSLNLPVSRPERSQGRRASHRATGRRSGRSGAAITDRRPTPDPASGACRCPEPGIWAIFTTGGLDFSNLRSADFPGDSFSALALPGRRRATTRDRLLLRAGSGMWGRAGHQNLNHSPVAARPRDFLEASSRRCDAQLKVAASRASLICPSWRTPASRAKPATAPSPCPGLRSQADATYGARRAWMSSTPHHHGPNGPLPLPHQASPGHQPGNQ